MKTKIEKLLDRTYTVAFWTVAAWLVLLVAYELGKGQAGEKLDKVQRDYEHETNWMHNLNCWYEAELKINADLRECVSNCIQTNAEMRNAIRQFEAQRLRDGDEITRQSRTNAGLQNEIARWMAKFNDQTNEIAALEKSWINVGSRVVDTNLPYYFYSNGHIESWLPLEMDVNSQPQAIRAQPQFADGVKYGLLYARRIPWEDRLPALTEGASNLWRIAEVEKETNTASAAYQKLFPRSTFEEGVEYGAAFALSAVQSRATNVTLNDIKAAAFAQKVRSGETNNPETSNIEHRTSNAEVQTNAPATNAPVVVNVYNAWPTNSENLRFQPPGNSTNAPAASTNNPGK